MQPMQGKDGEEANVVRNLKVVCSDPGCTSEIVLVGDSDGLSFAALEGWMFVNRWRCPTCQSCDVARVIMTHKEGDDIDSFIDEILSD